MSKINNFIEEFSLWFWTDEGRYYRELCTAWFVFSLFILIAFSDLIFVFISKTLDLLLIALLFGYLSIKRFKHIKEIKKNVQL